MKNMEGKAIAVKDEQFILEVLRDGRYIFIGMTLDVVMIKSRLDEDDLFIEVFNDMLNDPGMLSSVRTNIETLYAMLTDHPAYKKLKHEEVQHDADFAFYMGQANDPMEH